MLQQLDLFQTQTHFIVISSPRNMEAKTEHSAQFPVLS